MSLKFKRTFIIIKLRMALKPINYDSIISSSKRSIHPQTQKFLSKFRSDFIKVLQHNYRTIHDFHTNTFVVIKIFTMNTIEIKMELHEIKTLVEQGALNAKEVWTSSDLIKNTGMSYSNLTKLTSLKIYKHCLFLANTIQNSGKSTFLRFFCSNKIDELPFGRYRFR